MGKGSTSIVTGNERTWEERLEIIVQTMREMSLQRDPQEVVRAYGERMRVLLNVDGMVALSRRGLEPPQYKVTRSSAWTEKINPWEQPDKLPVFNEGLLGELMYGDEPRVINDVRLSPDDPGAFFLQGHRSLVAIPVYDEGHAKNMVVQTRRDANAFDPEQLPESVWLSNLFGRATHNLVLSHQVKQAYDEIDRELQVVASIQKSLLPDRLPDIPTMDLATFYDASKQAGGDYYDFFAQPDGRWGILIADVSGHGTPAAVLMAILHSLAHTFSAQPGAAPDQLLSYLNNRLVERYTRDTGTFVTAFYGVYCPQNKTLEYSVAGHPAPRVKRCDDGSLFSIDCARGLPLGILDDAEYESRTAELTTGDQIIFYTDGITEAMNRQNELFGADRLDEELENCALSADGLVTSAMSAVDAFRNGRPADDDQTMIVAKIL